MAAPTAFSDISSNPQSSKTHINLLRGWPNPALLPTSLIQAGANASLSDPTVSVPGLLYGPDHGFLQLRKELAKWFTAFFKPGALEDESREVEEVGEERICITGGASQSLGVLMSVFSDAGGRTKYVWCGSPVYMLAGRVFEDHGFSAERGNVRAIPEDEFGIDVEYLRRELEKCDNKEGAVETKKSSASVKPDRPWRKYYRHILYIVPTFSNPSSKTLPLKRRQDLVRLAREHDALVICDDVYDFLQWPSINSSSVDASTENEPATTALTQAILPRVVDVDRTFEGGAEREGADGFGNVVSNGSFSKIAGPGLRTGWVEGTAKLATGCSQAGTTRSGGAPSHLTSTFLTSMLSTNSLQTFIGTTLQPAYSHRYHLMLQAITKHLTPLGVSLPPSPKTTLRRNPTSSTQSDTETAVAGGYFLWLTLPPGVTADEVRRRSMEEENVAVAGGDIFEVSGDNKGEGLVFGDRIRLCFAWEAEEVLVEGVERLAGVIGRCVADRKKGVGERKGNSVGSESFW